MRGLEGSVVCVGTSERDSRCAFVVGCRKRLPRWAGWMHDSSPRRSPPERYLRRSDPRAADHRLGSQWAGAEEMGFGNGCLRMASHYM